MDNKNIYNEVKCNHHADGFWLLMHGELPTKMKRALRLPSSMISQETATQSERP